MTSDTPNSLSPTFQWSPTYLTQLQHIADTDEFLHEDVSHHQRNLSSSSSSAAGASSSPVAATPAAAVPQSGAYDWPVLKDAIKYRIRTCLEESFGEERKMTLHPATKLMPYVGEGDDTIDLEVVWERADHGFLCEKREQEKKGEAEGADDNSQTTEGGAEDATSVAAIAVEAEGGAGAASVVSAERDENAAAPQTNGSSISTAAAVGNGASPSSPKADPAYSYRQTGANSDPSYSHPPFVHRADVINFYPSKRSLPSTTSIPPLSPDTIDTQTSILYSMLDDFDTQPPFTIQRLCELIVSPTAHYSSAHKWIAAIKRCLSVTATRDAFPISPVQAPVGIMTNGTHQEGAAGGVEVSELEMDRMDGLPARRERSSSVASSGVSEPLFSPIPFIVRDENGQLTGEDRGGGDEGMNVTAGVEGALMEQIPDLELGGADRTQIGDRLPKEVVDIAPTAATTEQPDQKAATEEDVDQAMDESSDEPMQEDVPASATTAAAPTAAPSANTSAAAAADAVAAVEAASSASAAPTEPLGVPHGQVDEIDNPSLTVNPLTSTTTATADTSAPASNAESTTIKSNERSKADDDDVEDDTPRSTKRRKSVASIHDDVARD
ncbi:hypothetical protein PHSY_003003 [Pseudozyma hubeiensis SY62]|uniref:Uncharacterized protein n=1 Tax=Pseudozyma hubeiensis (strain SY62) TaxID=1305764 RepID=R9P2J2_PSEHS|nr:hypothetical protein PHSY_003003 [Pseudozyma hubeiensis SY62]GAC95427.1 hypothetical protein PHSY_003003 [Pseudozyma hubeiensis SY62]